MIIVIILVFILILGVILINKASYFSKWHDIGFVIILATSILLGSSLAVLVINQFEGREKEQEYYAIKHTIETSRNNEISGVERAALTTKIIEFNQEIAKAKYWRGTLIDIWIYDGFAELEYLE